MGIRKAVEGDADALWELMRELVQDWGLAKAKNFHRFPVKAFRLDTHLLYH